MENLKLEKKLDITGFIRQKEVESDALWLKTFTWLLMACYYTQSCGKSSKGFVQKHQNDQIRELERWAGSLWGADCRRVGTPWEAVGRLFSVSCWDEGSLNRGWSGRVRIGTSKAGDKTKTRQNIWQFLVIFSCEYGQWEDLWGGSIRFALMLHLFDSGFDENDKTHTHRELGRRGRRNCIRDLK